MAVGPCNPWQGMPSSGWAEPRCVSQPQCAPALFPEMGRRGRLPFILLPRLFLAALLHCKLSLFL